MAILGIRLKLSECKPGHLGPILLGRFLEEGFLQIKLSPGEDAHLKKILKTDNVPRQLGSILIDAAHRLGMENCFEDWNFEVNVDKATRSFFVWDPERVERLNIA